MTKTKFSTPSDWAKKKFSGWSGVDCDICGKELTKAESRYSEKYFERALCRRCQRLVKYTENRNDYS